MSDTRTALIYSAKYVVVKKHGTVPHATMETIPTVVDDVIDALQANPAWAKSLGIGTP